LMLADADGWVKLTVVAGAGVGAGAGALPPDPYPPPLPPPPHPGSAMTIDPNASIPHFETRMACKPLMSGDRPCVLGGSGLVV